MKKLYILAVAFLALGFTACEDVPAPYGINDEMPDGGEQEDLNVIYSETFENGQGQFTFQNVKLTGPLTYVWKATTLNGKSYLVASAYASSASHESESWAVSPAINLSDCTKAELSFNHAINKIDAEYIPDMMTVWASTDYAGDASQATWTQLTVPNYPDGTSWTFVESGKIDLTAFCGNEKVYIGFKYTSSEGISGSWEVNAFEIKGDGTPMTSDTPPVTGTNLLVNGDFESWTGGLPDNWKSTTTASNATLSQSTDAHSGTYSVKVGFDAGQNKRMAYKELTLKAGTYTMSFYAKSTTADVAQVRPGYAIVNNGSISASDYNYDGYPNVSNTEWTLISSNFTLTAETTVNLLVMNPKTNNGKNVAQDILIDDFSLVTSDGGIVGGDDQPEQPGTSTAAYSWDFKALGSQGDWTIDDKVKPEELGYVWTFTSEYGMKASAYNGTKYQTESWFVSPELDLTSLTSATLVVNHTSHFFDSFEDDALVKISTDGTNWTSISLSSYPEGWSWAEATADISALAGKSGVRIAFVYTSTTAACGTWEIDKVSIK